MIKLFALSVDVFPKINRVLPPEGQTVWIQIKPDFLRLFVRPDPGVNGLQRLSADDKIRH